MLHMTLGFSLHCDENMIPHLQKVFSGEYEVPLDARPRRILDLGANVGAFSIWASHRWPSSLIFAYEPHPENFAKLKRNTENYPNVVPLERGVGNPGVRLLLDGESNSGEASLVNQGHYGISRNVEVISPLNLPEADILKIDTEGCELEILTPLLADGRTFEAILLEWHSEADRREIDRLLADYRLVRAEVADIDRGVSCYLRKRS